MSLQPKGEGRCIEQIVRWAAERAVLAECGGTRRQAGTTAGRRRAEPLGSPGSTTATVTLLAPLPSDYGLDVVLSYSPSPPAANGGPCYVAAGTDSATCTVTSSSGITTPTDVTLTPYLYLGAFDGNPTGPSADITVYPQLNPTGPCPDCNGGVGQPINLINGDTWITQQDYSLPGLGGGISIARTWNSLWQTENPVQLNGMFGNSWRSTYEERVQSLDSTHVFYWRSDGSAWIMVAPSAGSNFSVLTPENQHATLSVNTSTYTLVFMDGSQHIFNLSGYLTALIDRNGNQTNVSYDTYSRISQVEDAASRIVTFNYSGTSAQVQSVQDSTGTIASYTYTSLCPAGVCSNFLSQVAYADSSQYNFTYDTSTGLVTSVTDAAGHTVEAHAYDSSYRGITSERASGVDLVTVSYPSFGSTEITNSLGYTSSFAYANSGISLWITGVTGPTCSTCGAVNTTSSTFDSMANRLTATDANGNTTTFTYDSMGDVLTRTNSVSGTNLTWTYTYNSLGEVLTATDPLSHTTTNTYDSYGNLLTTTTPSPGGTTAGSETVFTYDSYGNLHTITDPLGNQTTLAYFSTGLVSYITDAKSGVTSYTYDARGNRLTVKDALNNTTTFTYDAMNRVTKITYPDSSTTQFAYDTRGRRTSVTGANSKVTTYAYDNADRLTGVTDAASNVTTYAYDFEDDLTSITDANSHQTSFTYDDLRRVTQTTFPSALVETYAYDNVGNLTSKTDRKSQTIAYAYDTINRLTKKTYSDSTTVTYTYDNASRLTQVVDPTGTYQFTFDNMGRLTGTSTSYSFLTGRSFNVSYSYDAASNRTGMTDPESGSYSYTYDQLNRLAALSPPSAFTTGSFGFTYDADSRRTQMTRPNGVTTNYSYDTLSRLLSVLHQVGTSTIDGATYTVDSVGNRTAKTDKYANVTSNYTYDALYELTQVTQSTTTTESYSYDAVGNRSSSLGVSSYTNNASNELTATSNASYTYDSNGNTTGKTVSSATTSYAWDYENRLSSVTLPGSGGTVSFKYDPFGRRIYKSSAAATSIFVYDLSNEIEEASSGGVALARYAHTLHIDDRLAMLRSAATSYYQVDGLDSVTSMSGSGGSLASTYAYDSFGNVTTSSGSIANPFQYTFREFDSETNLQFSRARYYDAQQGRFINQDPLGFGEGINFYVYTGNNPTNLIDPTGLAKCCPSKEQDDVQKQANNAQRRLDHLSQFGTAVLPTDTAGNIGAMTGCSSSIAILPNGQRVPLPSQYPIQINVDPNKHPCIYECTLKHEMVHQRMCRSLGATRFAGLSEAQQEIPAYTTELGCFLKMQMDNQLGPYK